MVKYCLVESYKLAACIHYQFSQQRESDIADKEETEEIEVFELQSLEYYAKLPAQPYL